MAAVGRANRWRVLSTILARTYLGPQTTWRAASQASGAGLHVRLHLLAGGPVDVTARVAGQLLGERGARRLLGRLGLQHDGQQAAQLQPRASSGLPHMRKEKR